MLSTPPAFVLSQDQTLQLYILTNHLKLKLKKSRIGLQQKIAATAHSCFGLLCIGPPYYCSVFKDQLRIAAATANIICFVFKVKLYFFAAVFFYFQPSANVVRCYYSLRWAATLTCFPLKCQAKNQLFCYAVCCRYCCTAYLLLTTQVLQGCCSVMSVVSHKQRAANILKSSATVN